ncbi:MAG TPA: phosphopantetheine-binding protein [Vicinamibacterales bacterium]|nr:phosphopantetheine-binding protein [Vicinamibacterales bacterium]
MNEFATKITEFIITEVNPDLNLSTLAADEPLIESGIVDSLGVLKILAFLDEAFGVDLSSDQIKLENFKDVRSICGLLERAAAS